MNKSILLTLSVLLLSISLSAQIENNKPLIVLNEEVSSKELNSIDPNTYFPKKKKQSVSHDAQ